MSGFSWFGGALLVLASASLATAGPPVTYPLNKVTRGQTGYGMTTFAGNTPERFTFEVISVVTNFLPKQDIILVKSDDPKMQTPGFWQGMSGSPLYIDDKLVCAFSYGFRFNKVAVGGCTPIDYMKHDGETIRRQAAIAPKGAPAGAPKLVFPAAASMDDWRRLTPRVDVGDAMAALGPNRRSWLLSAPLPVAPPKPSPVDGQVMTASVPLSVAGFSAPAFASLAKLFDDGNVVPVRAGGSSGSTKLNETGPKAFVMGGAIAVELVRGDMSAAATGTVSYIDGNKVLAFGHPFFQTGETYAPVSTATVHTVIPSSQSAFVMATPMNEVGTLTQDRQSSITADLGLRTPTIPMAITIISGNAQHSETGTFNVEIVSSKFLTPALAGAALMNSINYYVPDRDDVTAKVDSSVRIKGQQPIEFVDYMYANDGAASVMGGVRGLRALVPLMLNPYAPLQIQGIDIKVDLRFESNFGELKEVRIPTTELVPGVRNVVQARMSTWDGSDIWEDVPVDVPMSVAGSIVQLELTAGDNVKLDTAPPVDLTSLLAAFHKFLPGNVWAATIYPADEGIALDGKLVRDLPSSAADKLHPQSRTQRVAAYRPINRTVAPAKRVVNGSSSTLVRVRAAK